LKKREYFVARNIFFGENNLPKRNKFIPLLFLAVEGSQTIGGIFLKKGAKD
jgi:hypothetical protein